MTAAGIVFAVLAVATAAMIVGLIVAALQKGDSTIHAGLTLLEPGMTNEQISAELKGILAATAKREAGPDAVDAHFDTLPTAEGEPC